MIIMFRHAPRPQTTLGRNTRPNLPKRSSRSPAHTKSRDLNLIIQLIDLLECKTLRLFPSIQNQHLF